jgi:acetyl esterase/lipase
MRSIIYIFLFFISFQLSGQSFERTKGLSYETIADILYLNSDYVQADTYMTERCKLDLYYPTNKQGFPIVVFFHGGGLTNGNKFIPLPLMDQGIAVATVNYRLSPKIKNPAYTEDAAASVAWVFNNISRYGGDTSLIFISGHSAGAYLANMVGMDKKWLDKYGIDANRLAGIIPLSGNIITHFTIRKERGIPGTKAIVDEYAPVYYVRPDAPPLILITGDRELELLGRYEENAYMARMMKVVGHKQTYLYELDGFNHGAMLEPACHILLNHIEKLIKTE